MKTKVKIAKRLLSILLVFLFSINSFAAIVSDNDGSAFVTKAEFEALKKSFNSQIQSYNDSIDGKIDGAIASYLAGLQVSSVELLANTTSILEYPIKIYSTNKGTWDMTNWEDGTSGLWRPSWNLKFNYNRTSAQQYLAKATYTKTGKTEFLDLKRNTTTGNYNINQVYDIKDVTLNVNYWILWYDHGGPDTEWTYNQRIAVVLDPKSWWTSEGSYTVNWVTFNCQDNYSENILVDGQAKDALPFIIGTSMGWGATTAWSTKKTSWPYDTIKIAGQYPQAPAKNVIDAYSTSMTKTSKNLQNIYNGSADSYVPVCFDGSIYITNNNQARSTLLDGTALTPQMFNGESQGCPSKSGTAYKYINLIIEPGYCLEPVDKGSPTTGTGARTKDKRCLWHPDDVYYIVDLPQSRTKIEHKMTDGILLSEVPSNVTAQQLQIEIDTSLFSDASLDSTADVNIVFSKDPIGDINGTTLDNCYYIYDSSALNESTKAKTKKLISGINEFYIKDMTKGSKLYYKVYYDSLILKPVTINEPTVTLVKEN